MLSEMMINDSHLPACFNSECRCDQSGNSEASKSAMIGRALNGHLLKTTIATWWQLHNNKTVMYLSLGMFATSRCICGGCKIAKKSILNVPEFRSF